MARLQKGDFKPPLQDRQGDAEITAQYDAQGRDKGGKDEQMADVDTTLYNTYRCITPVCGISYAHIPKNDLKFISRIGLISSNDFPRILAAQKITLEIELIWPDLISKNDLSCGRITTCPYKSILCQNFCDAHRA